MDINCTYTAVCERPAEQRCCHDRSGYHDTSPALSVRQKDTYTHTYIYTHYLLTEEETSVCIWLKPKDQMLPGESSLKLSRIGWKKLDNKPEEEIAGVWQRQAEGAKQRERLSERCWSVSVSEYVLLSLALVPKAVKWHFLWLTLNLFGQRLQQLQPHLQQKPSVTAQKWNCSHSVCSSLSYIVAVVVSELQSEVLFLQQLQMAADFVEEVSA